VTDAATRISSLYSQINYLHPEYQTLPKSPTPIPCGTAYTASLSTSVFVLLQQTAQVSISHTKIIMSGQREARGEKGRSASPRNSGDDRRDRDRADPPHVQSTQRPPPGRHLPSINDQRIGQYLQVPTQNPPSDRSITGVDGVGLRSSLPPLRSQEHLQGPESSRANLGPQEHTRHEGLRHDVQDGRHHSLLMSRDAGGRFQAGRATQSQHGTQEPQRQSPDEERDAAAILQGMRADKKK